MHWLIVLDCVFPAECYFPHNANDMEDTGLFCDWQGKKKEKLSLISGHPKNVADVHDKKK